MRGISITAHDHPRLCTHAAVLCQPEQAGTLALPSRSVSVRQHKRPRRSTSVLACAELPNVFGQPEQAGTLALRSRSVSVRQHKRHRRSISVLACAELPDVFGQPEQAGTLALPSGSVSVRQHKRHRRSTSVLACAEVPDVLGQPEQAGTLALRTSSNRRQPARVGLHSVRKAMAHSNLALHWSLECSAPECMFRAGVRRPSGASTFVRRASIKLELWCPPP